MQYILSDCFGKTLSKDKVIQSVINYMILKKKFLCLRQRTLFIKSGQIPGHFPA